MELRQIEMEQEKEWITHDAQITELEAMEGVLSTTGSRILRTERYSSIWRCWEWWCGEERN